MPPADRASSKHRLRAPLPRDRRRARGKAPRQLLVEPGPVDLVRQDDKRVFQVDDLIETGTEKIVMSRFLLLFRSHSNLQNQGLERITKGPKNETEIARR